MNPRMSMTSAMVVLMLFSIGFCIVAIQFNNIPPLQANVSQQWGMNGLVLALVLGTFSVFKRHMLEMQKRIEELEEKLQSTITPNRPLH